MDETIERWLAGIRNNNTRKQYLNGIKHWLKFIKMKPVEQIEQRHADLQSDDFEQRHRFEDKLQEFINQVSERSTHTAAHYGRIVESFFKANYMRIELKIPKSPRAREQEHIPTRPEIKEMVTGSTRQLAALIMVLAESGARVGAVLQLRNKDVELEGPAPHQVRLRWRTMKGDISCVTFICDDAAHYLKRHITRTIEPDDTIFDLSVASAERAIRNAGVRIGICEKEGLSSFVVHSFRKRVQTCFDEAQIPGNWADLMMGHIPRHTAQAAAYSRPTEEKLRDAYARAAPYLRVF